MKRFLAALLVTVGLGAAAAQDDSIHLGYVLWDSEISSTHVVAAVLMDELGYDVELTSVDAGPMFTGLAQGDLDVIVRSSQPGSRPLTRPTATSTATSSSTLAPTLTVPTSAGPFPNTLRSTASPS